MLVEQAERYAIPFDGPTIDRPAVVRKLHDVLAENKYRFGTNGDDPRHRYDAARARKLEIELDEMRGALVSVDLIKPPLGELFVLLRGFGDRLAKQAQREILDDFNETIDEFVAGLDRLIPSGADKRDNGNGRHS